MTGNTSNRTLSIVVLALGTLAALSLLLQFGILGVGRRGGEAFADVKYWYVSARMWLAGASPYDYGQFKAASLQSGIPETELFAYPPTSFILGALISPFSFQTAKIAWLAINLCALLAIVVALHEYVKEIFASRIQSSDYIRTFLALLIIVLGNPFTTHVIWIGQTSLIVAAAIIWAWRSIYNGHPIVGGVLLAVSGAKPQLSALVGFWLLLDRRFLALGVAAVASLALIAVPFSVSGIGLPVEWLSSMQGYQSEATKAVALSHNTNLRSLLHAISLTDTHFRLRVDLPLAMLATFLIWLGQDRYFSERIFYLGFLISVGLLLIFGRDYDLAAAMPLLVAGAVIARGNIYRQAFLAVLLLILCFPHRLVMRLDVPVLTLWRPVTLLVMLAVIAYWNYVETRSARSAGRNQLAPSA